VGAVLSDAFPSERRRLDALVVEAGLSRVYAGFHYRFDVEAGQDIDRRAAAKGWPGRSRTDRFPRVTPRVDHRLD
jgi:hypothetical protein